ncbi:hypothetical protein E2C01_034111 [Portunus trituberculatus]|uniref:Uncharacterized protein n=1 Tax=Portunus trituberculatus TaxID=210409 RepID=A0A5B7EZP0_PORTR|nr:hypothetical protein [Portunus trituberculatus]
MDRLNPDADENTLSLVHALLSSQTIPPKHATTPGLTDHHQPGLWMLTERASLSPTESRGPGGYGRSGVVEFRQPGTLPGLMSSPR